jgi:hypothetical protein
MVGLALGEVRRPRFQDPESALLLLLGVPIPFVILIGLFSHF